LACASAASKLKLTGAFLIPSLAVLPDFLGVRAPTVERAARAVGVDTLTGVAAGSALGVDCSSSLTGSGVAFASVGSGCFGAASTIGVAGVSSTTVPSLISMTTVVGFL
jgi:hypothetical protein